MLNGYKIIDADSHIIEPHQLWAKYIAPEFKDFVPTPDLKIKGEEVTRKISQQVRKEGNLQMMRSHPNSYFSAYDVKSHLRVITKMGIDLAFIYPTCGLWLFAIDTLPPEVIGAFTHAYNTWLYEEFCSYNPAVLKGVGAINLHAPEQMVSEVNYIAEFGWKAVFLRPNPIRGRILSDPVYEPFWTACEELNIAVGIHEGTHSSLPTTGMERFNTRFGMHACSHPLENMMALLALIEGGVLERHPQLRVAFLECGCGWVPYWLWRLDQEYKNLHWEVANNVRMLPSDYFRRQCFVAVEPSELYLAQIIEYIGADNLIFGSDYPHMDHNPNIVQDLLALEATLSKEIINKIVWDNPQRFYNLV